MNKKKKPETISKYYLLIVKLSEILIELPDVNS